MLIVIKSVDVAVEKTRKVAAIYEFSIYLPGITEYHGEKMEVIGNFYKLNFI